MSTHPISRALSLLALAAFLLAAAPRTLPQPNPRLGSIGISIRFESARAAPAELVYFTRLDDADQPLEGEDVLTSDLAVGSQAFLLNAEPGRWAVVAVARVVHSSPTRREVPEPEAADRPRLELTTGRVAHTYLDRALVQQTVIEVKPGELAFMGEIQLAEREKPARELDSVQRHYAYVLETERSRDNRPLLSATVSTLDQSPETARAFWKKAAEKSFKASPAWASRARQQAEALPAEPKTN